MTQTPVVLLAWLLHQCPADEQTQLWLFYIRPLLCRINAAKVAVAREYAHNASSIFFTTPEGVVMRNVKILAALGLMTMAGVAQADVSGTATIVTDYDFRGVTQTGNGTALQLSLDYATEGGWYVGTWGSNIGPFVNWDGTGSAPTEMDVYTGFKGATEGGLGWDAGVVYYAYPGASDLDYAEIYGKLSYSIVSGGVYYSDDFGGTDGQDSFTGLPGGDAYYVYGDLGIPAGPVIIGLHAGLSSGDGVQATYASGLFAGSTEDSYVDYAVGITYPVSGFNLGFKWISTDAGDGQGDDDRIILTLGTAFPWAK